MNKDEILISDMQIIQKEADAVQNHIDDLKAKLGRYNSMIASLEDEWLKTHNCSCGLFELSNCPHK